MKGSCPLRILKQANLDFESGEVETCYSVSISTQFQIVVQIIFLKKYVQKDGNTTSLNRNHFSLLPPWNFTIKTLSPEYFKDSCRCFFTMLIKEFWQHFWICFSSSVTNSKVHLFWEGHKILQNLHLTFVLCSASQK